MEERGGGDGPRTGEWLAVSSRQDSCGKFGNRAFLLKFLSVDFATLRFIGDFGGDLATQRLISNAADC